MFLVHRPPKLDAQECEGWLANITSIRRENTVFAGKQKPTADQTMPTMTIGQRVIGIHIHHCERLINSVVKSIYNHSIIP